MTWRLARRHNQVVLLFGNRSRRNFLAALGAITGSALCDFARGQDAAALLAQAVHDRPSGRDMTSLGRMELTESGRAPRVREIVTYRVNSGGGNAAILMRFLSPPDIAGTGLLSIEKADGANDQWLYLPALDRVRRVAGDRKGGRFVGSDLYFEDLRERKPDRDQHRGVGRESLAGVACEIVESRSVDASDSVYRKRVSWIDPVTALLHRVDYYEKDDQSASKQWVLLASRKVQGYWAITDSRMTDLSSGHQTRVTLDTVRFDRRLPAKLFSTQALADPGLEAEFRP